MVNSEINNNEQLRLLLYIGSFTGRKLFLIAAKQKVVREIHFSNCAVAVVFALGSLSNDDGSDNGNATKQSV